MFSNKIFFSTLLSLSTLTNAHTVITYPGWRGNNLITNTTFPRGMQWTYPCGGIEPTTNRTYWPLNNEGGAVAVQPGWFKGHSEGLIYINIGLGENPENYSFPLTMFHFTGPAGDNPYPGSICLPKVTLTSDVKGRIKNGDRGSIQVVQASKHGAAQYNCADVIFTEDLSLVPPVNESVCFNSSYMRINEVGFPGPVQISGFETTTTTGLAEAGETNAAADEVQKGGAGRSTVWVWNLILLFAAGVYVV